MKTDLCCRRILVDSTQDLLRACCYFCGCRCGWLIELKLPGLSLPGLIAQHAAHLELARAVLIQVLRRQVVALHDEPVEQLPRLYDCIIVRGQGHRRRALTVVTVAHIEDGTRGTKRGDTWASSAVALQSTRSNQHALLARVRQSLEKRTQLGVIVDDEIIHLREKKKLGFVFFVCGGTNCQQNDP